MPGSVSLGTVHVSLEMRLQQLKEGVRQAKGEISGLQRDIRRSSESMRRDLSDLGRTLSIGVTAPMLYLGKQAVDTAVRMDSLKRSLNSLTGNAEETEKQLLRLREAAKLPGLGFTELIEGTVRLQSAGLSAKQAEGALKAFGNALAIAGGSKEDLREVGVQLSQIASSGKLQGDELRIIAERVPQVRAVLKEAFGTASSEEIAKYGIEVNKLLEIITSGLGKLPQATDSAQNKIDNLKDTVDDLKRAVGDALLPTVVDALETISEKVQDTTKWFKDLDTGAKESLGKLATGGVIMGPALLGVSALWSLFSRISASPFFQWLTGVIKSKPGLLTPAMVAPFLPESSVHRMDRLYPGPDLEPIIPGIPASILGRPVKRTTPKGGFYDSSGTLNFPMRVAVPEDIKTSLMKLGANTPAKVTFDQLEVNRKRLAREAAEKAAKERAKQEAFAKGYSVDSQIDVLRSTGHPFRADIMDARRQYQEDLKRGANRADAQRVLSAKIKEIWTQYYEWQAAKIDKTHAKERAIYEEQLKMEKNKRDAFAASLETVKSGLASLRTGAPVLGLGPSSLVSAAAYAAAKAGRLGPGMTPGTLAPAQVQQGKDFMQVMEQLADVDKGRQLDKLMKSQKAPEGFLGLDKDLAQQMKPKVEPFTFELGRVLGDNLAQEMGREFGAEFDKVFGTKNPLFRALSRTFSRLVDDLLYSVIQRGIGNRLLISLFGSAGGGAAGGAMSTASAAAFGASSAAKGGAAKAAGISAGQAWTAGFYIAAAWGLSRVLNSIFRGTPQGRANLQGQFAARPGMQAQAMGLMNFSGMPVVVNFHGANFNGKDDPRRVASSVAWHVANQMRVRPGS